MRIIYLLLLLLLLGCAGETKPLYIVDEVDELRKFKKGNTFTSSTFSNDICGVRKIMAMYNKNGKGIWAFYDGNVLKTLSYDNNKNMVIQNANNTTKANTIRIIKEDETTGKCIDIKSGKTYKPQGWDCWLENDVEYPFRESDISKYCLF